MQQRQQFNKTCGGQFQICLLRFFSQLPSFVFVAKGFFGANAREELWRNCTKRRSGFYNTQLKCNPSNSQFGSSFKKSSLRALFDRRNFFKRLLLSTQVSLGSDRKIDHSKSSSIDNLFWRKLRLCIRLLTSSFFLIFTAKKKEFLASKWPCASNQITDYFTKWIDPNSIRFTARLAQKDQSPPREEGGYCDLAIAFFWFCCGFSNLHFLLSFYDGWTRTVPKV